VLERLVAGIPVARADIQAMGPGGLLMEIISRPQPRSAQEMAARPDVAAVILAAGQSTRMGSNKLLETVAGKPVVRHVAEAVLASRARPALVVLGHEAERVRAALAGLEVGFVENARYAEGMSTSLRAGVGAVPKNSAGALVVLGDMPKLTAAIINRIIDGFAGGPQDALAVAPVAAGRRGNPVLIARGLLPAVEGLTGDMGARGVLDAAGDRVVEVTIDEDAVLLDVDTPQALAQARAAMG
jgi:molybdenum cofactor cytidylyltransferase